MTTRPTVDLGKPRLRLNAPADVLATIPFLVGFHPTDSVVVLGMCGRRLTFTARADLPDADAKALREHVKYLVDIVLRQPCDGALVVGFGTEDQVTPTVNALCAAFAEAGVAVKEALRAHDGRYVSYLCKNAACCPPDGVPYASSSSAIAATWTLAGRVARRDRAEFEAQIEPATGPARESMARATAVAHDRMVELIK